MPMTAEQLEELLDELDKRKFAFMPIEVATVRELALRVIAAENLVSKLDHVLCQEDDHWASMLAAVTAYRVASK